MQKNSTLCAYMHEKQEGREVSTTGTIYGVYDMSRGEISNGGIYKFVNVTGDIGNNCLFRVTLLGI